MRSKVVMIVSCVLFLFTMGSDCKKPSSQPDGEEKQEEQTEQMHSEAVRQVGMPDLTNFQELRFAKQIMELRDEEITTYTYTVDRQGRLHFVCQSVGVWPPVFDADDFSDDDRAS